MAKAEPKRARGKVGVRGGLLGLLAAAVAALAIWLSDCVPGFGIGGEGAGKGEAETPEAAPAEPAPREVETPAAEPTQPSPKSIEIGVFGCKLGADPAEPCADLCKRIAKGELAGSESVTLESAQGSQADVTAVIDCLKAAGITKVAIRTN